MIQEAVSKTEAFTKSLSLSWGVAFSLGHADLDREVLAPV